MIFKKSLKLLAKVTDKMNQDLVQYTIRLAKKDSAMLYFILEANENIAFYSTLEGDKAEGFRDIQINCHTSLKTQLDNILGHFSKKYPIQYLD